MLKKVADFVLRRPQVTVTEVAEACDLSTAQARKLLTELERWRVVAPTKSPSHWRKPILLPRDRAMVVRLIAKHDGVVPCPNPLAMRAVPGITATEREVLDLLAEGLSSAEIARLLFLSPHTVKTHITRISRRLTACNRTHLVSLAYKLGHLPNPYKKES